MILCWHQEIACLLTPKWSDIAEGSEFVIARKFVFRIFIYEQLLALLCRLHELTFDEHLDL